MNHILRSATGAVVAGIIATGCATSPPASEVAAARTAIDNAGQAIDQASADPHVVKYAPSELERATASLQKAKAACNDKHDLTATRHFAYLAQQRAATAQEFANERAADDAVKVAAAELTMTVAIEQRRGKPSAIAELAQKALVGFAPGTAKIPASAKRALDELAATLKSNPEREVVIEGYTDNVGGPRYNQALALKRAAAVRTALLQRGIASSRIAIRSLGEGNPASSNASRIGRLETGVRRSSLATQACKCGERRKSPPSSRATRTDNPGNPSDDVRNSDLHVHGLSILAPASGLEKPDTVRRPGFC